MYNNIIMFIGYLFMLIVTTYQAFLSLSNDILCHFMNIITIFLKFPATGRQVKQEIWIKPRLSETVKLTYCEIIWIQGGQFLSIVFFFVYSWGCNFVYALNLSFSKKDNSKFVFLHMLSFFAPVQFLIGRGLRSWVKFSKKIARRQNKLFKCDFFLGQVISFKDVMA